MIKIDLKKMIFINTIGTFILCFLTHFLYEWIPNPLFSLFFPVNESIWEHMKMLYTTILLYGIIEFFILKKLKIANNNFGLTLAIKALISIPIYLIIFLPIYYNFGEIMIVSFIILLITIFIVNFIGYKMLKLKPIKYQKTFAIISILIIYIIMAILTYKAPRLDLFFDPKEEKYGINDFLKK